MADNPIERSIAENTLQLEFHDEGLVSTRYNRPNWWRRFWIWALLGWTWIEGGNHSGWVILKSRKQRQSGDDQRVAV
jgi:hypothetical protein